MGTATVSDLLSHDLLEQARVWRFLGFLWGQAEEPVLSAMTKTADSSERFNPVFIKIHDSIRNGGTMHEALMTENTFPGFVADFVDLSEETGTMDDVSLEIGSILQTCALLAAGGVTLEEMRLFINFRVLAWITEHQTSVGHYTWTEDDALKMLARRFPSMGPTMRVAFADVAKKYSKDKRSLEEVGFTLGEDDKHELSKLMRNHLDVFGAVVETIELSEENDKRDRCVFRRVANFLEYQLLTGQGKLAQPAPPIQPEVSS